MYDHLPPRLAKYLAAIYTGTDVPEIEQGISTRDLAEAAKAYAETWVRHQRIMRWNKQRGQTINQLNQRIHEQRLQMRELRKQIDVFNGLLEIKTKMISDLTDELYNEREKARELRAFAHETTRRLTNLATNAAETFIEHDSDWEFK